MNYITRFSIIPQFILLLCLLTCATHYSTTGKGRIVATEITNVKSHPDHSAVDIATVDRGTNLILVEKQAAWYKVKLPNGLFGWIHESVVKPESFKIIVLDRDVEMRYRPDRYAAVMMIIPKGSQFKELERSGDWVKIQAGSSNTIGWAPRGIIDSGKIVEVEAQQGISLYTNSEANIRTGPGLQHNKITTVSAGTQLTWIATENDWYNVQMKAQQYGYIWKELVTTPPYYEVLCNAACDLKTTPSANSPTIKRLTETWEKLQVLDTRSGWYLVELADGSLGWINSFNTTESMASGQLSKSGKFSLPFGLYFAIRDADVYSDQAERGTIVGHISPGMHLKVKNSTDAWCQVELPDGSKGYLSRDAFVGIKGKYLITADNVNFRGGAGTNFPNIETRDVGLNVILLDVENDWCRVAFENDTRDGWIWSQLLLPSKYRIIYVTEQDANVRASKSLTNTPIEHYDRGTEIPYVEKSGNWYKFNPLVSGLGPIAWLHETVVCVPKYGYGVAVRDGAIRINSGENYDAIYNLRVNQEVPILDQIGSWYQVEMPDNPRIGYIQQNILKQASYKPLIALTKTEIRSTPNQSANIVVSIDPGTELTELQQQNDWHLVKVVRVERNFYGWVHRFTVVEPNYGTISVSGGEDLRYGPGKEFLVRSRTSGQKQCKILDYEGNWYQVEINNITGWIYKTLAMTDGEG